MTDEFDQAQATKGLTCPVCAGPVELVCQGKDRWRVSCLKNDFVTEGQEMPCDSSDVYGATPELAISNFKETP